MTIEEARKAGELYKEFDKNKTMHGHMCEGKDLQIRYTFDGQHYSHYADDDERQALIDVWRERRLATKEKIKNFEQEG